MPRVAAQNCLMAVVASSGKNLHVGVEGDPGKGGRIKQYFAADRRLPVLFIIDMDNSDNLKRITR